MNYLGCAATAEEGVSACKNHHAAIAVLDVQLGDGKGLELIGELAALRRAPRILLLTSEATEAVFFYLSSPKVAGMVYKNTFLSDVLRIAIGEILSRGTYVPKEIAEALRRWRTKPDAFFKILSRREIELLPLVGRGDTDDEVASHLGLKASTIKSHRHHILKKLGLPSNQKLMRWALEKGFVYFKRPAL